MKSNNYEKMNFDKTKLKTAFKVGLVWGVGNSGYSPNGATFSIDKQKHTENPNIYWGFFFLFEDKDLPG